METLGQRIYRIDEVIWDIYHRLIYYPEDSSIYQEIKQILRLAVDQEQKLYAQLKTDSVDYRNLIYQLDSFYQKPSTVDSEEEIKKSSIMGRIESRLTSRDSYLFLPYHEIMDEVGSRETKVLDECIGENIFTHVVFNDFEFLQFSVTKSFIDQVEPEKNLQIKMWCCEQTFLSPVLEYGFFYPEQAKNSLLSHELINHANSIGQKDMLKNWMVSYIDEFLAGIAYDVWYLLCEQIRQEEKIDLSFIPLHALYLLIPDDYKDDFITRIKRLFNKFNLAEPMLDEEEISLVFAIVDDFFQQIENEKQERENENSLTLTKQIGVHRE